METLEALHAQCDKETNQPDNMKEPTASRIRRDNKDTAKLVTGIKERVNPFEDGANNDNLYCLSTGKAMPVEIAKDIVNIEEKGEEWRKEFADGCFGDPSRFEKSIPMRKIENVASAALTTKVSSKGDKILEIRIQEIFFVNFFTLPQHRVSR